MLPLLRNKNIKIIVNYVLGPLAFILLALSIYRQILEQRDWKLSFQQLSGALHGSGIWMLMACFLLVFVNWGLEARKWQLSILHLQAISFTQSFKAILAGNTMASFTPNRTGEYIGRILYIGEGKRAQAIAPTIVCSMAQLQVTMYAGIIAIFSMWEMLRDHFFKTGGQAYFIARIILYSAIVGALLLTLFYFRMGKFVDRLQTWKPARKWRKYIMVVQGCNATILLQILSLSVVRYLVFVVQYYLLFRLFHVDISWTACFQTISSLFLLLAIVPSFTFLTDLGIRWKAGIEIVCLYSANAVGIFAAAFSIWVFNLIIPALIGSLLILNIRVFKNKQA